MKTGAQLIAEERERQISQEGWTQEHDDAHKTRQMASAAAAYLQHYVERSWIIDPSNPLHVMGNGSLGDRSAYYGQDKAPDIWPDEWENDWKPKSMLSDLVRAGALVAAEIDRLQRKSANALALPEAGRNPTPTP